MLIGNRFNGFVLPVFMGFLMIGCPKAKGPDLETPAEEAQAPEPVKPEVAAPLETVAVGTDWTPAPGVLEPVYFDLMRAELSDAARSTLKKNAAALKVILKAAPGVKVRVEGHCDERGTLEYNLALGQQRANALRSYFASLGLPKAALSTISYGEERPVCDEFLEECWRRNRRGETTVRSPAGAVQVPIEKK